MSNMMANMIGKMMGNRDLMKAEILKAYIDIQNKSGKTIRVELMKMNCGHWETSASSIHSIPAQQTELFVAKGCDRCRGDVICEQAMKLTVLGSDGSTECDFSFTNTDPPAPFLRTTGYISGIKSVESTFSVEGTFLRGTVKLEELEEKH